jgi:F-type H+-transporting ATPase subunit a
MLHVIEAVVQAYIFGMLALIYIAGALEPNEGTPQDPKARTAPAKEKQ